MRQRARLAPLGAVILGLGLVLGAGAGRAGAEGPAPAASPGRDGPPLAARLVLSNGIVVLVAERPGPPVVYVRVSVEAGAVLDPPDKAGLANLTARLLTRGTRGRSALEIDRAIEFVGGSLESDGGREGSGLSLSVLRRDLALGLDLLADVLLRPAFREAEVTRTREEVLASIRQSEQDPEAVAARILRRLAFPGHPYGWPVAGTEATVGRIARQDVVTFYETSYRPEATTIAVVGAIGVVEAEAALAARFAAWKVTRTGPSPPDPVRLGAPARTELTSRELTQASVYLGQASVGRSHADYYPLLVASQVLGGGSASRLYNRVREERGLAYSVFAQLVPGRYGGVFLVGFQSENARVREGLTLVRDELVRLRRERVSRDELARAQAALVGSFLLEMDTGGEIAGLLLGIERFGLGLDYPTRFRRAIEGVTADDLLRAVRTHWDPDAMSLAVVGELREAGLEAR